MSNWEVVLGAPYQCIRHVHFYWITKATLSVTLYIGHMGSYSLLGSKSSISCKGYNVNLQSAAILVFLLYSSATFCIGYNVNLQTAVAAILVFVECPISKASEVLVVLRPYQNVKSIRPAVFNLPHSQAMSCI